MKTFCPCILAAALFFCTVSFSQENYNVNGETYSLKTEVSGTLTLLWNVIGEEYRYFAQKGETIEELKNTRTNGKYLEEYKVVLASLTADQEVSVDKTNLTLTSLSQFFNDYNKKADAGFEVQNKQVALQTRLGVFGGISNNVSTTNPQNVFAPHFGAEFELTDADKLKNHALVVQFRQTLEADDYQVQYSQFSLNYRYKFIYTNQISVFINAKLVTLNFFSLEDENEQGLQETSGSSLQAPVGLGLGLDYKLGNGFLTFSMNDLVAPGIDSNDEFSLDFNLGYKFNL